MAEGLDTGKLLGKFDSISQMGEIGVSLIQMYLADEDHQLGIEGINTLLGNIEVDIQRIREELGIEKQ